MSLVVFIKEIGKMINQMDKESLYLKIMINMKAIGKMENGMEKAHFTYQISLNLLACGRMDNQQVKLSLYLMKKTKNSFILKMENAKNQDDRLKHNLKVELKIIIILKNLIQFSYYKTLPCNFPHCINSIFSI